MCTVYLKYRNFRYRVKEDLGEEAVLSEEDSDKSDEGNSENDEENDN